jgi:hypothetical protein
MLRKAALALGLAAFVGLAPSAAHAQRDEADRRPLTRPPQRDTHELRRVTVTVNPLAVVMGRYGANVELLPARHHAVHVSGHVHTFSMAMVRALVPEHQDRLTGGSVSTVGGELGYRFYTGRSGADGLFAGPSFVVLPLAYPRLGPGALVDLETFHAVAGALDVGAQAVTSSGFTIGGGAGAMILAYNLPNDPQRLPLQFTPRVLPRLLLTAGWSF